MDDGFDGQIPCGDPEAHTNSESRSTTRAAPRSLPETPPTAGRSRELVPERTRSWIVAGEDGVRDGDGDGDGGEGAGEEGEEEEGIRAAEVRGREPLPAVAPIVVARSLEFEPELAGEPFGPGTSENCEHDSVATLTVVPEISSVALG